MNKKTYLYILLFISFFIFTVFTPHNVYAFIETITATFSPVPTATYYQFPTNLPYCSTSTPFATGTSLFPTPEITTPVPCQTVTGSLGESCITTTPYPTSTIVSTSTLSPTITNTPVVTATLSGSLLTLVSVFHTSYSDSNGNNNASSYSCSPVVGSSGKAVDCTFVMAGFDNTAVSLRDSSYTVSISSSSTPHYYYAQLSNISNSTEYFLLNNVVQTFTNNVYSGGGSNRTSTGYFIRAQTGSGFTGNFSMIAHIIVSSEPLLFPFGTSTPSPTSAPTLTPPACLSFDVSPSDDPIVVFDPVSWEQGSCFTVLPETDLEMPSIPFDPFGWSGAGIHVDGLEICTQFYNGRIQFAGIDFLAIGSVLVSFICAVILYREWRT